MSSRGCISTVASRHSLEQKVGEQDYLDSLVSIVGVCKLNDLPTNLSSGEQSIGGGQVYDHFGRVTQPNHDTLRLTTGTQSGPPLARQSGRVGFIRRP